MSDFSIVHVFAPNVLAGAERVVLTGLNALADQNYDVSIILIKESRNPQHAQDFYNLLNKNVKVITLYSDGPIDFNLVNGIKQILQHSTKKIILHTHGYKALILTNMANRNINIPIVHTHHGNTSHTLKVKIYEWIALQYMKRIDSVICVSSQMKKILSKKLDQKKLVIIENMLSFKNIETIKKERVFLKDNLPLNLIFVGRLSPEKGALHFLKIFYKYQNRKSFKITYIGDGPERDTIISFIQDNNLENLIETVGFINDPSPYFIQADALIMPSFTEGMPMTLIESLCCGVPVIANNVGAISELLINNSNGILLKNNEEIEWKKALDNFLLQKDHIQDFAFKHAVEIESKYSVSTWLNKTLNLYRTILKI